MVAGAAFNYTTRHSLPSLSVVIAVARKGSSAPRSCSWSSFWPSRWIHNIGECHHMPSARARIAVAVMTVGLEPISFSTLASIAKRRLPQERTHLSVSLVWWLPLSSGRPPLKNLTSSFIQPRPTIPIPRFFDCHKGLVVVAALAPHNPMPRPTTSMVMWRKAGDHLAMRQHGRGRQGQQLLAPSPAPPSSRSLCRCLRSEELPLILTIMMDSNEVAETGHFSLSTAVDLMDSEASLSTHCRRGTGTLGGATT